MRALLPLLLAACGGASSGDSGGPPADTGPYTGPAFDDPADPNAEHVLVSSLINLDGHALEERTPDLAPVWTFDTLPETGAQGAVRLADGSTVFARTHAPPLYRSSFDLIDAEGNEIWSYDDLAAVGFSHGVQPTPAGDFIGLDTVAGVVISFDAAGTLLWEMSVAEEDGEFHPNGISVRDLGGGEVRMALSMLERPGDQPDRLALYALGARDALPTRLWKVPVGLTSGHGAWPHGPHILADGTVTVCQSAAGQVVGYAGADGAEQWRTPETGAPALFSFPRDAVFLSDGSMVVGDGGAEILRVDDPFGSPRVVGAADAPGIFGLSVVTCGVGGGLPCLGTAAR